MNPSSGPFWASVLPRARKVMWWRRHGATPDADVINAWVFPISVRRLLVTRHPQRGPTEHALVEAATRQWFRIVAANPRVKLAMPSAAVDELWHELILHTREYAASCDAAFVRSVNHRPESGRAPRAAGADRSTGLLASLRAARTDERCSPTLLPLLFCVDERVGLSGGRRYMADCGGSQACFCPPGTTCMRHPGILRRKSAGWRRPRRGRDGQGQRLGDVDFPGSGCGSDGGCGGCGSS